MKKDKPRIDRCLDPSGDCNDCTHRPINQDQCVSRDEPKIEPERLELRCSSCDWTGEEVEGMALNLANEHCFTCPGHVVRSYKKGQDEPKTTTVLIRKGQVDQQFLIRKGRAYHQLLIRKEQVYQQRPGNPITCSN